MALQVAEQMSDYLIRGAITNAVNFPSITAEEAPKLKPFIALAEGLGSFAGQLTTAPLEKVKNAPLSNNTFANIFCPCYPVCPGYKHRNGLF